MEESQDKILVDLKSNMYPPSHSPSLSFFLLFFYSSLKLKRDTPIKEFVSKGNAAFFRLSTRSPKDAVDKMEKLKVLIILLFFI